MNGEVVSELGHRVHPAKDIVRYNGEILKREKGFSPQLLLDDVFEKLDEERITNLLAQVCGDEETQIFITDTNCGRLKEVMERIGWEAQVVGL